MHAFGLTFLAALAVATALRLWLAVRHVNHIRARRDSVPAEFAAEVSLSAHQRAADYTCARTRLAMAGVVLETAAVLWLTFGGGLQAFHEISVAWFGGDIARGLALIVMVTVFTTVLELPLGLYRTFRIEERFGFNRMSPATYFADLAKATLVAAAFGLPLAVAILWLMQQMGMWWWLYAWCLWVAFNLFMLAVYPTWIAPLFNKFTPMRDPDLKSRVERLLERCGFRVKGLLVMDGSRRSSHGNAYFTGFGSAKRIVFFDTLLERLAPAEVEAVLAHELGHFRLRHVVKRMAWVFAVSLGFLWLLAQLMQQPWFFLGLGVESASTAMALVLFFLVLPSFTFPLQPLLSMYSRRHEFEADQYASQHAPAQDLVSALVKLYKDNASTLTPDPLHSAFYDTHPPALQRIARLHTAAGS